MNSARFSARLRKEMEMFVMDPPPGISCCFRENSSCVLDADIIGPPGSPYEGGVFHLEIQLPNDYPFQPPIVCFTTPIYHPNIDECGRICLELLKLPPSGSWRCTVTLANTLMAVQCLMSSPNPADPLELDIAELMVSDIKQFEKNAREHTMKYCIARNHAGNEARAFSLEPPFPVSENEEKMECD